jgi:hypothetical protein
MNTKMNMPADYTAALTQILNQAEGLVSTCKYALAALQETDANFRVEEETDDYLAYRLHRQSTGRLSDVGKRVIERMLVLGWTDERIKKHTKVSAWGIGQFRRRLGRRYAQNG